MNPHVVTTWAGVLQDAKQSEPRRAHPLAAVERFAHAIESGPHRDSSWRCDRCLTRSREALAGITEGMRMHERDPDDDAARADRAQADAQARRTRSCAGAS